MRTAHGRPHPPRRPAPRTAPDNLSRGEYATLVMLVAGTLIGTAFFLGWLLEQRDKAPTALYDPAQDDGSQPVT